MDKKNTSGAPFVTATSSWWLMFTGRALCVAGFLVGIVLIFVGMALDWSLLSTFALSGGLMVFGMIAYVLFRAFSDVVARLTDIHNLLEERYNQNEDA